MGIPVGGASAGNMRRWYKWLGAFVLATNLGLVAVFGLQELSTADQLLQFCVSIAAGVLLILSSFDLPWDVEWYRLAGVGYICLGSLFLFSNLDEGLWLLFASIVGAFSIALFGFDLALGGRFFRVNGVDSPLKRRIRFHRS